MGDTAVVVCSDAAGGRPCVGGLSLVARALLVAKHAGYSRLLAVGSGAEREALAAELDGDPRLAGLAWLDAGAAPAAMPGRCLVLLPEVVVTPGELRAWISGVPATAEAVTPDTDGGGPLLVASGLLPAAIAAARGGRSGLAGFLSDLARAGRLAEIPWGGRLRERVGSPADAPAVERRMLRLLRTPEDGPLVDRFVNRAFSGWLTRGLLATAVTPNQVTVASLLTGLLGAWVLGYPGWGASLLGLVLFQLSVVLDHSDGEIARLKLRFSPFGKWLDNWSDHTVDIAVVGMLTWRVAGSGGGLPWLLGILAAVGVTGAFLIVFRWSLVPESAGARPPGLESLANRDGFCLSLWATLLLGRPAWFLWLLAVGANLFWLVWLARVGLPPRRD
jgi:phosphatidylglycerophosphate synthase